MFIGVGDRGRGVGGCPHKIREKYLGQLLGLCKIRAFSGKNHVKFGYFDNLSDKNHVKFGNFADF